MSEVLLSTGSTGDPIVSLAVAIVVVAFRLVGAVRDRLDDEPEPYTPEYVQWQYEQGYHR